MWYPVKVLHIRHNLFAGTDALSFYVYEPIAIHNLLEDDPQCRGRVELNGVLVVVTALLSYIEADI